MVNMILKGREIRYKSFLVFRYFLFSFDILSFMYREVLVLAQCERAPLEYRFYEAETAFIFLQKDSCAKKCSVDIIGDISIAFFSWQFYFEIPRDKK